MKKTRRDQDQRHDTDLIVKEYGRERNHAAARRMLLQRKRKRTAWLALLAVLVLGAAAVWLLLPLLPDRQTDPTGESTPAVSTTVTGESTVNTTTDTTTRQTATPTTAEPTPAMLSAGQRQAALQAAADQVIDLLGQSSNGRFGVFFMNLSGGESWAYQDESPFVAASSIKLGINVFLYTRIAAGDIRPDDLLTYDSRSYPAGDYEPGTGTIQNLPNGSQLTVRETSGLSIRISDNCGINMIIRRLGGIDLINNWLNDISGRVDYRQTISYTNYAGQSQNGRHRTCARDLGLQAVRLYELWQEQPAIYSPLIEDLSHTEFDFGIQKGLPETLRVAHKIGTNGAYSTENDVGIVFTEEPFVLCVMTEMASAAKARQIQADIAAIFYDHVAGWPWE